MPQPFEVPYRKISGLPQRAQQELRRDFDEISRWGRGLSGAPFIVVAADGSGDFTTIHAAVASVAASTPTVIYIKPGNYATTGAVNVSNLQIWFLGTSLLERGADSICGWTLQTSGFTNNNSTRLKFSNIFVNTSSSTAFGTAGWTVHLDNATFSGGRFNTNGSLYGLNSSLELGGTGTFSWTMFLELDNCTVACSTGTNTLTTGGNCFWHGGSLSGGNLVLNDTGANSGRFCSFEGVNIGGQTALGFTGHRNLVVADLVSNTVSTFGPTYNQGLATLTITNCTHATITDNTLQGTDLAIVGAATHSVVSGTYHSATLAGTGNINVVVDGARMGLGAVPAIGVAITGNGWTGAIHVLGCTVDGVNITGSINVLMVSTILAANQAFADEAPPATLVNVVGAGATNNKVMVDGGAVVADTGTGTVFL